jgi:hypothetical protein
LPGVHSRVEGERPAFGAQTCGGEVDGSNPGGGGGGGGGGGDGPGMPAHELWGVVIVAGGAHTTATAMACCEACQQTDGCNVWWGWVYAI